MEIGNLKEKEAGISFYDHLTGLPTMTLFFEMAEKGCLDLLKDGKTPALYHVVPGITLRNLFGNMCGTVCFIFHLKILHAHSRIGIY